ncbi:hypothetical protein ACFYO5_20730 [Streptomyces sp. NPDC006259]|uniref:hypothetical protein n=1 Tax=Streptomyces sp. NPDC006259 TaxID=3364740 RepID=UPI00369258C0
MIVALGRMTPDRGRTVPREVSRHTDVELRSLAELILRRGRPDPREDPRRAGERGGPPRPRTDSRRTAARVTASRTVSWARPDSRRTAAGVGPTPGAPPLE